MQTPFFFTGPIRDIDSAVSRSEELESVIRCIQRDEYISILAPRQAGKTTFLFELQNKLIQQKYNVCYVDLEGNSDDLNSLIQVLQERVLNTQRPNEMGQNKKKDEGLLLTHWLHSLSKKVIFLVDELPLEREVAYKFLASIRAYHNESQPSRNTNKFKNTRHIFVISGSTDLAFMSQQSNAYVSPFNIAREVSLHDFSLEEISNFILKMTKDLDQSLFDEPTVTRIFELASGHPFLTQYLCYHLCDRPSEREKILTSASEAVSLCEIEDTVNVQSMVDRLWNSEEMREELKLLRAIINDERYVPFLQSVRAIKNLELQGCIIEQDGKCNIRNPIYRTVFKSRLNFQNLLEGDNDVKQQVRPIAQNFGGKVRRFYGRAYIQVLDSDGVVVKSEQSEQDGDAPPFFPLSSGHSYELVFSLVEGESGNTPEHSIEEALEIDGVENLDNLVEYIVRPESFAFSFATAEVMQSFRPHQAINGRYPFRFETPILFDLRRNQGSGNDSEYADIFFSLYQGSALVQVSGIRVRIK